MNNLAQVSNKIPDLETAREVLETEIKGLQNLKDSLGEPFEETVLSIDQMRSSGNGRLIVAGIGKSGHICRKMAATLASTGTPAYFVHPGEASHGDMGMITKNDIVLMLSNSGENSELSDLIHYTRRFGIKLIAMTSKPEGTLAKHSDIVLLLPKAQEACPNGMAPTTSTTMMIAYGDALAVALLKRIGLTAEDFGVYHPGGKLGKKLLKVSDVMHEYDDLPIVSSDTTMDQAILTLSEKNLGCVLIIDDNQVLKGVITDGDLKRHMDSELLSKTAGSVMSLNPKTIESSALAVDAVNIMTHDENHYITNLVVTDEKSGNVTGLIRLQDCFHAGIV